MSRFQRLGTEGALCPRVAPGALLFRAFSPRALYAIYAGKMFDIIDNVDTIDSIELLFGNTQFARESPF